MGDATTPDGATSDATMKVDAGLGVGVADVPNTPCVMPGGSTAQVLAAEAGTVPPFRSLQAAGSRRVADFTSGSGFVTFDANGQNAASVIGTAPVSFGYVASTAGGFALVGPAPGGLSYVPYDPTGAMMGSAILLSDQTPSEFGFGASATSALVGWSEPSGVTGRGLTGSTVAPGPFLLALTSLTRALSISVIDDGSGLFAYAFSGDQGGTSYQTVFGRATTAARVQDPVALFTGQTPRQVVQLAKTPSGYALLVAAGGPDPFTALVILNPLGDVAGVSRLVGAVDALSLAVQGSEIGVAAVGTILTDSGDALYAPEFRPFDDAGSPLGSWVCLQAPVSSVPTAVGVGLAADGTGYAAIVNANDGSAVLARFDHLGTGSQ